jgi:hypothetical protein
MRNLFVLSALALLASQATAAISIDSRTSYIYYRKSEAFGPNFPTVVTDEETETGIGTKVASAGSYGFTSTVNANGITTGKMKGLLEGRSSLDYSTSTTLRMKLEVTMTVTEGGAKVDLLMNGNCFGGGWSEIAAEAQNAYIAIIDASTNTVIFDSDSLGTFTGSFHPERNWVNSTWSGILAAGSYRIAIGTDGDNSEILGPGAGWKGSGDLDASLTFTALIPAPSTLALAAPLWLLNLRRRK